MKMYTVTEEVSHETLNILGLFTSLAEALERVPLPWVAYEPSAGNPCRYYYEKPSEGLYYALTEFEVGHLGYSDYLDLPENHNDHLELPANTVVTPNGSLETQLSLI
jgi:hypothetical protein